MVDAQHRTMFDLLNKLVDACMDGTEIEKLQETLDFLANYAVKHTDAEEALQVQCGFPDYKRHKRLHDEFKESVGKFVLDFRKNGSSSALSNDINQTVIRWLINHIQFEDKKIGLHIDRTKFLQPD